MMDTVLAGAFLTAILFAAPQTDAKAGVPGPVSLADLAWLAGTWVGPEGTNAIEEHWSEPRGSMMLGLHHRANGERTVEFEFLRIERSADGALTYQASPGGRPATPFRLVESGPKRAVFANPDHDFPQRILYWIDGDGRLHAKVEGQGKDGQLRSIEWTWTRK